MEVNYKEMPGKAVQMQGLGRQLNGELSSAWTSVNELRSTWHGVRYNSLIMLFNKVTGSVNKILSLVVSTIPDQLGTIARNYSIVDGDPCANVEPASPTAIEAIENSDTSSMSYDPATALSVKESVTKNLSNAKGYMENIVTVFNTVDWVSEARSNYQSQLETLKGEIVAAIDGINTQFSTLMSEAENDMKAVENANNVGQ